MAKYFVEMTKITPRSPTSHY